jgi:flagellar biosynthesis/type III secretory pathway M-ring protein FliF/YscJ
MQIIIARSTVNTLAKQTQEITNTVISAMGEKPLTHKMDEMIVKVSNKKNISVDEFNGDVVVDINDEIFFKYMSLYIKLITMIMPFVGMLKMVGNMLKAETRSLVDFIEEEKEKEEGSQVQPDTPSTASPDCVGKEPAVGDTLELDNYIYKIIEVGDMGGDNYKILATAPNRLASLFYNQKENHFWLDRTLPIVPQAQTGVLPNCKFVTK